MNLCKKIGLATILFLSSFFAMTQNKDSLIGVIRKDFQKIIKDSTLKQITLDAEDFMEEAPDRGATLTGYYKKGSVVRMVEWIGISNGNRIVEYYFKNGELFFTYEKFESFPYNMQKNEFDYSTKTTSFEGRYYFNQNKLIEQKTGGLLSQTHFHNAQQDILSIAQEYRKLLLKKF